MALVEASPIQLYTSLVSASSSVSCLGCRATRLRSIHRWSIEVCRVPIHSKSYTTMHMTDTKGMERWASNNTTNESQFATKKTAFDLEARELAAHASDLAKQQIFGFGEDPLALERAWAAVAFQAEGLAGQISVSDACSVIRSLSRGGVLARHEGAYQALFKVIQTSGCGVLKPRKLVSLWSALDRADALGSNVGVNSGVDKSLDGTNIGNVGNDVAESSVIAFFHQELPRALPPLPLAQARQVSDARVKSLRAGDHEWRRLLALLSCSGLSSKSLQPTYKTLEDAAITDGASIRALSSGGLISAARAVALSREAADTLPDNALVERICDRLAAQARWLDGWAASHAVLALARLGIPPGRGYDPLRNVLLQRLSTRDEDRFVAGGAARSTWENLEWRQRLAEVERVAAALACFGVHDKELREHLAAWLFRPMSPAKFYDLAIALAHAGLNDTAAPQVSRHVRARARSSELRAGVGAPAAAKILVTYARGDE